MQLFAGAVGHHRRFCPSGVLVVFLVVKTVCWYFQSTSRPVCSCCLCCPIPGPHRSATPQKALSCWGNTQGPHHLNHQSTCTGTSSSSFPGAALGLDGACQAGFLPCVCATQKHARAVTTHHPLLCRPSCPLLCHERQVAPGRRALHCHASVVWRQLVSSTTHRGDSSHAPRLCWWCISRHTPRCASCTIHANCRSAPRLGWHTPAQHAPTAWCTFWAAPLLVQRPNCFTTASSSCWPTRATQSSPPPTGSPSSMTCAHAR